MKPKMLTDADLLLLGLVAEMPRHGYEIERAIEERGMREWTQIGFSSIYFVLSKLEKVGLVAAETPAGQKARKVYTATPAGLQVLIEQTLAALRDLRPSYSSVLLGLAHWPAMPRTDALAALLARREALEKELSRLHNVRLRRQPMPDFVEAMFDYSAELLAAEKAWLVRTLDYMSNRP